MSQRLRPIWMDEHRRNSAQLQVAGIEIGALLDDYLFLRAFRPDIFQVNPDSMLLLLAHRFDNTDATIGDGPIDFGSVPELQLILVLGLSMLRGPCGEALCFGQ